ncbi:phage holin family protein [Mangrovimonas aestuarii]|uniref:phage holin family protein n=1 Tax=Mangrovimonas aestuarii TaxID=3018443 RepID=UPI002377F897|nr:phage holin family protein [Mangrovimonas aestuarii]
MKLIIKLLLTALAVVVLARILPGVQVEAYSTAIIVAVVLALLNVIVKPLLVLFTLPATILTLGLFLFVINAVIILLADKLVDGFGVASFWWALLFSVLLSVLQSILYSLLEDEKQN